MWIRHSNFGPQAASSPPTPKFPIRFTPLEQHHSSSNHTVFAQVPITSWDMSRRYALKTTKVPCLTATYDTNSRRRRNTLTTTINTIAAPQPGADPKICERGGGGPSRPKTNLVHSNAARKPLVATISNILSTMFYVFEEINWWRCHHYTVPLSHIRI